MVHYHPSQFTSGQLWSRKKLQAWTRRWYNWPESLPAALEPKRRRPCYISCSKLEYHQHHILLQAGVSPTLYPAPNCIITNTISRSKLEYHQHHIPLQTGVSPTSYSSLLTNVIVIKRSKEYIMLIFRIVFGHRSCVIYVTTLSAIW